MHAALLALCLLGAATPGGEYLKRADQAFRAARYEEVLPALAKAREAGLPPQQAVHAGELEAMTHAAFGDLSRARDAFGRLLLIKPDYRPDPMVSPKIRQLFEEARAQREKELSDAPRSVTTSASDSKRDSQLPSDALSTSEGEASGERVSSSHRWWLWTAAGVLVAGGVVAAVVATHSEDLPRGTLGSGSF